MTFSIVAWDKAPPAGPEWGVAVASKFLAVGAAVPWGRAGAGALATQALANLAYGPEGLDRLASGAEARAVVSALTQVDAEREHRQIGVIDARGNVATYTGRQCMSWAGGYAGDGFCCQGNILAGPEVVEAMAAAFETTEGDLAARLVEALASGDRAGGDRRGKQSAALLVVSQEGGYGGGSDRAVDLRVDDHPEPVPELARLLELHRLFFPRADRLRFFDIDDALAGELRALLGGHGYDAGTGAGYDDDLRAALLAYVGTENLEERWTDEIRVEGGVLDHLRGAPGPMSGKG